MVRGRSTALPIYQRALASGESSRGRRPSSYDAAMATTDTPDTATGAARGLGVELNALNTIAESERRGKPRDLFWPWFAANVSVFGISYGAFLLGFGISFAQAVAVGLIGIVVSFLLCGVVSLAGKRGSAPTMVLSRAAFGVNGNRLPVGPVLAAHPGLGDGAGLAGRAGHRHRADRARPGRRDRHEAGRPGHHRGADRAGRRGRLLPDHAAADGDHAGHRRPDRRLHRPGPRPGRPGRRRPPCPPAALRR